MDKRAPIVLKLPALLGLALLAGEACAQAAPDWPFEDAVPAALRDLDHKTDWPAVPADGTQTFFRIRHNDSADTVVGVSVQQSKFPSFLLQLELVPPQRHFGAGEPAEERAATLTDDQHLRTVHRLTLRYRF